MQYELRRRWFRNVLLAGVIAVLAALALGGYWLVWRPRHLMREVGVDPDILSGQHCSNYSGQHIRRCDLFDNVQAPRMPRQRLAWQQVALFELPTRALRFLEWRRDVPDSLSWETAQDSARRAMQAIGAQPLTCPDFEEQRERWADARAPDQPLHLETLWRFPEQDVRLEATMLPGQNGAATTWEIRIQGLTTGLCRPPAPPAARLMTPEEMSRAFQEWLEHEIGL